MKTYARIEHNIVQELFSTSGKITELFHPSMQWVEITDLKTQPAEGWHYMDGAFTEPEPVTLLS